MGLMPQQVKEALAVEIFDKDGQKHVLGDLVKGQKTAILFVRHFCELCCPADVRPRADGRVRQLSSLCQTPEHSPPAICLAGRHEQWVPPRQLAQTHLTAVIIISCGSYQPISNYLAITKSPYPVYANPTLELYKVFGFTSTLAGAKAGEEKDYMKDLGSYTTRVWNSIKRGPLSNISQAGSVGPKSQNGGELVLDQSASRLRYIVGRELTTDGEVLFFHRMENTADHAELREVAQALGVELASATKPDATRCEAGAKA
jgi:hypothetical protein